MTLGGMANDLEIKGIGTVAWTFDAADGYEIHFLTQAYWVPNSKARLLSPQKLFNKKKGTFGQYQGDEESFRLILNDNLPIQLIYNMKLNHPLQLDMQGLGLTCNRKSTQCSPFKTKICQIHRNFYWTGTIDLFTSILHESNMF
jgi:hypothetical protein